MPAKSSSKWSNQLGHLFPDPDPDPIQGCHGAGRGEEPDAGRKSRVISIGAFHG